jgi:hypothetical protein
MPSIRCRARRLQAACRPRPPDLRAQRLRSAHLPASSGRARLRDTATRFSIGCVRNASCCPSPHVPSGHGNRSCRPGRGSSRSTRPATQSPANDLRGIVAGVDSHRARLPSLCQTLQPVQGTRAVRGVEQFESEPPQSRGGSESRATRAGFPRLAGSALRASRGVSNPSSRASSESTAGRAHLRRQFSSPLVPQSATLRTQLAATCRHAGKACKNHPCVVQFV